jgi:hypothetical protein
MAFVGGWFEFKLGYLKVLDSLTGYDLGDFCAKVRAINQ